MTQNSDGKAPLEQIFENWTARVLDHLVTMTPFDYSFDELSEILGISRNDIVRIVEHLKTFGFIDVLETKKIRIANNPRTNCLAKLCYEIAIHNMDEIVKHGKQSGDSVE